MNIDGSCLTEADCKSKSDGYVYKSGKIKRCMTRLECTMYAKYYVNENERTCVSEDACKETNYIFSEEGECVDASGCVAKGEYETDDMNRRCVKKRACKDYQLTSGDCVTADACETEHSGYIFEEGDSRLCLTKKECNKRGYYFDEAEKTCAPESKCQKYLFFAYGENECLDADRCAVQRSGFTLDGSVQLCLTRDQCTTMNMISLGDRCVSSVYCEEQGYTVNATTHNCD